MLADAVQGATRPSQIITWTRSDNTAENLTGATITGVIVEKYTGEVRAIAGVLTVTNAAAGVFTWDYAEADVATAGEHEVQFTAVFGSAPTPARTLLAAWTIHKAV